MPSNKCFYIFLHIVIIASVVSGAVMHSHSNQLHKEREEDGAYSPRDHGHISDSGEHHSEFDHEAIIGKCLKLL